MTLRHRTWSLPSAVANDNIGKRPGISLPVFDLPNVRQSAW
jgi:hypothetical protein